MAQWIPQNSGGNGFLTQVFFPSQDTGYVVDWNMPDSLLKTTNGGNDWNRIPSIFPIVFFYFTSSDTGYAITANQEIIQTTNGGLNWSVQKHFTNFTFLGAISFSDKNTGYTCGFHTTENDTLFLSELQMAGLPGMKFPGSMIHLWEPHTLHVFRFQAEMLDLLSATMD